MTRCGHMAIWNFPNELEVGGSSIGGRQSDVSIGLYILTYTDLILAHVYTLRSISIREYVLLFTPRALRYERIAREEQKAIRILEYWLTAVCSVSQKTSKIIFVITTSNFHQIWYFLAQWWQIVQRLYEVHSFSTSPNSRQCTTVLNADVPNC